MLILFNYSKTNGFLIRIYNSFSIMLRKVPILNYWIIYNTTLFNNNIFLSIKLLNLWLNQSYVLKLNTN